MIAARFPQPPPNLCRRRHGGCWPLVTPEASRPDVKLLSKKIYLKGKILQNGMDCDYDNPLGK